jgi:hypothetical protein
MTMNVVTDQPSWVSSELLAETERKFHLLEARKPKRPHASVCISTSSSEEQF